MPNALYIVSVQVASGDANRLRADVVLNVPASTETQVVSALCTAAAAISGPLMDLVRESLDGRTSCILSCPASARQIQSPGEETTK